MFFVKAADRKRTPFCKVTKNREKYLIAALLFFLQYGSDSFFSPLESKKKVKVSVFLSCPAGGSDVPLRRVITLQLERK